LTLALSGIGAVLGVVISPIGAVVAGIALFASGIAYAYQHSETFRNAIAAVGTTIKGLFAIFSGDTAGGSKLLESIGLSQSTIATITSVITTIKTAVFAGLGAIKNFFMAQFTTIKTFMDTNGAQIFVAVQNAFKVMAAIFAVLWPVVKMLIVGTWDAIKNVISGALKVIMGVVKVFTGIFTGDFSKMWEGVKQIFFGAIQAAWGYINLLFVGRILKAGKALFTGLRAVVSGGWTAIKGFFSKGIKTSGDYVTQGWTKIKSFFSGGVDAIQRKVSLGFQSMVKTISSKLGNAKDDVMEWGKSLPGKLFDAFKSKISTLTSIGTLVWDQIKSTLPSVGSIVDYVSDIIGGSDSGKKKKKSGGSHYSGAYNIPRNGYQATLHSGESVLTASQSQTLRNSGILSRRNGNRPVVNTAANAPVVAGGGGGTSIVINMQGPVIREEADIDALARKIIAGIESHDERIY
jgi:phage-related protein